MAIRKNQINYVRYRTDLEPLPRLLKRYAPETFSQYAREAATGFADKHRRADLRRALWEAMKALTPRERQVINLRFGWDGDEPLTYAACGERMGVTRERVRQIESRALRQLRHPERDKPLRAFLTGRGGWGYRDNTVKAFQPAFQPKAPPPAPPKPAMQTHLVIDLTDPHNPVMEAVEVMQLFHSMPVGRVLMVK